MNLTKTLSLLMLVLFANTVSAQLEKGTIQLGADGVSNLVIGDRFALEDWILMPEASYFLADRLSLGVSGIYRDREGLSLALKEYNIGLLGRYYFFQKGPISFNVESYVGAGEVTAESDQIEELNFKEGMLNLGIGAGINYHIIPQLAFSFSLRGNRDFELKGFDSFSQPLDFRFGLRVNLATLKSE